MVLEARGDFDFGVLELELGQHRRHVPAAESKWRGDLQDAALRRAPLGYTRLGTLKPRADFEAIVVEDASVLRKLQLPRRSFEQPAAEMAFETADALVEDSWRKPHIAPCRRETFEFDRSGEDPNLLRKRYTSIPFEGCPHHRIWRKALSPEMMEQVEPHRNARGASGMSAMCVERDAPLLPWMEVPASKARVGSSFCVKLLDAALTGITNMPADKGGTVIRILTASTVRGRSAPGSPPPKSWQPLKRAARRTYAQETKRSGTKAAPKGVMLHTPAPPCSTALRSVTALSRRAPGRPRNNVLETTHAEREVQARWSAGS